MTIHVTIRGYTYPSVVEAWRVEGPPGLSIKCVYKRHEENNWDWERCITRSLHSRKMKQLELFVT